MTERTDTDASPRAGAVEKLEKGFDDLIGFGIKIDLRLRKRFEDLFEKGDRLASVDSHLGKLCGRHLGDVAGVAAGSAQVRIVKGNEMSISGDLYVRLEVGHTAVDGRAKRGNRILGMMR